VSDSARVIGFTCTSRHRAPDTAALRGPPHIIWAKLREALLEVWWEIGEGVLNQLVNSMLDHVQALIAARGCYTEF